MSDHIRQRAQETDSDSSEPTGLIQSLIRRRWFFIAPFFSLGLIGYVVANMLPLLYRSSSTIIVEQQKVPELYVQPNVLMNLQRRLDSMTQQILSRTRMQRFIEDFGLYANERKKKSMDEVIDVMLKRANIELIQTSKGPNDLTGFRVNFSDIDPQMAQRVTNELTSLFIEQDARERTSQSQRTTAFLESQLEAAGKELADEEERVKRYKMSNLGQLPSQQESNLRILTSLEAQLTSVTAAMDRAEQQRTYLESMRTQLEVFKNLTAQGVPAATAAGDASSVKHDGASTTLSLAVSTLQDLWKQLNEASKTFTDKHPDVQRLKKEIADWENVVQRLKLERISSAETELRLKAILLEIENGKRDSEVLRRRIREVQGQVSQTPVREQELAEITRQHENAKANFQSLLQKKNGSELSSNLEERQGGERFRLLDPASFPKKPEARQKIIIGCWAFAFAVGAGLTLLREMLDPTIHKQGDLTPFDNVPILARIPTLRIEREEKRRKLLLKVEVATVSVFLLLALASGAQTYLQG